MNVMDYLPVQGEVWRGSKDDLRYVNKVYNWGTGAYEVEWRPVFVSTEAEGVIVRLGKPRKFATWCTTWANWAKNADCVRSSSGSWTSIGYQYLKTIDEA